MCFVHTALLNEDWDKQAIVLRFLVLKVPAHKTTTSPKPSSSKPPTATPAYFSAKIKPRGDVRYAQQPTHRLRSSRLLVCSVSRAVPPAYNHCDCFVKGKQQTAGG